MIGRSDDEEGGGRKRDGEREQIEGKEGSKERGRKRGEKEGRRKVICYVVNLPLTRFLIIYIFFLPYLMNLNRI